MHSKHCKLRNQQRCIPPIIHDWLSEYGEEQYDGHGGIIRYFSSKSKKEMERDLGRHFIREIKKYLNMYRVESSKEGLDITAGRRIKRIKR